MAARSRYQRLHPEVPHDKLVVYTTTQTHSLGLKAGLVLGLSVYAISVHAEDNYSLRGQGLRDVIERDKAEGKHPFVIGEVKQLSSCPLSLIPSQSGLSVPRRVARLTT